MKVNIGSGVEKSVQVCKFLGARPVFSAMNGWLIFDIVWVGHEKGKAFVRICSRRSGPASTPHFDGVAIFLLRCLMGPCKYLSSDTTVSHHISCWLRVRNPRLVSERAGGITESVSTLAESQLCHKACFSAIRRPRKKFAYLPFGASSTERDARKSSGCLYPSSGGPEGTSVISTTYFLQLTFSFTIFISCPSCLNFS